MALFKVKFAICENGEVVGEETGIFVNHSDQLSAISLAHQVARTIQARFPEGISLEYLGNEECPEGMTLFGVMGECTPTEPERMITLAGDGGKNPS